MNTFIQNYKNSFLVVSLTTLSLLFSSSKELYEKLFVEWFDACRIVIDTNFAKPDRNGNYSNALVSVLAYGDVPSKIRVKFIGSQRITSVTMMHSSSDNLIMHEHVSFSCPTLGTAVFCETSTQEPGYYNEVEWTIINFNKFVTPVFKVNFKEPIVGNHNIALQTFIKNFTDSKACKVEPAQISNFWTWGKTWFIPSTLFVLMILFISLSRYLESKYGNGQGEEQ